LKKSGFKTQIACCDNDGKHLTAKPIIIENTDHKIGWENSRRMVEQMEAATGASANAYEKWVGLVTSHGYSSPPTTPLPTEGKKVWETECQCYPYASIMRK